MDIIGAAALIAVGIVARRGRVCGRKRSHASGQRADRDVWGAGEHCARSAAATTTDRPPTTEQIEAVAHREESLGERETGARSASKKRWPANGRSCNASSSGSQGCRRRAPSSCCSRRSRTQATPRRGAADPPDRGGDQARSRTARPQHPVGLHAAPRRRPRRRDDGLGRAAVGRRHEGPDHRPRGPQHPRAGEPHRRRLHHRRHARARSSSRASTASAARSPG